MAFISVKCDARIKETYFMMIVMRFTIKIINRYYPLVSMDMEAPA